MWNKTIPYLIKLIQNCIEIVSADLLLHYLCSWNCCPASYRNVYVIKKCILLPFLHCATGSENDMGKWYYFHWCFLLLKKNMLHVCDYFMFGMQVDICAFEEKVWLVTSAWKNLFDHDEKWKHEEDKHNVKFINIQVRWTARTTMHRNQTATLASK